MPPDVPAEPGAAPGDDLDLFDATDDMTPAPELPADEPALPDVDEAPPAADLDEGLFPDETPATEPPVEGMEEPLDAFSEEPPAQEELPPQDDLGDDLFGGPAPEPESAPPAQDDFGDDLFGPPAEESAPPEDGAGFGDDLFDEPAAEPADEAAAEDIFGPPADEGGEPPADDGFGDDLFDMPAEEAAPPEAAPPADQEEDAGLDDIFGRARSTDRQVAAAPVTAAPAPPRDSHRRGMRTWTDDTGVYQTVGRLVVIARTHVKLLKDNGRYATVPLHRLSDRDMAYVLAVADQLTRGGAARIASR
jgi:hypothetical protein